MKLSRLLSMALVAVCASQAPAYAQLNWKLASAAQPGSPLIGFTDEAATNLRAYMLKGGLVIFDDFEVDGGQWENFEAQFRRALPEAEFIPLDLSHPVYHSFFDMNAINLPHPTVNVVPGYYGVHEDNDPKKRLLMIINYNTDVSQYWEWSGRGLRPFDDTNEAYKLGVNYLIYGLTH